MSIRVGHAAIPAPLSTRLPLAWIIPVVMAGLLSGCTTGVATIAPTLPAESGRAQAGVTLQERREWVFPEDRVRFDNRMPTARLNAVMRAAPYHYLVEILPETTPINPSPWYGFRVTAEKKQDLRIDFHYPGFQHRYDPKLGASNGTWRQATSAEFTPANDGQPASLQVEVGPESLLVFAQPPHSPKNFDDWIDSIEATFPIERSVVGRSVQGRALHLFEFGGGDNSPLLIIVGRMHPPESTGSGALFGFVETLVADTPQARAFREQVRTVVVPLVNPDGLAEGHWRTNIRGKDLNRDWGPFTEPETQAVARALLERSEGEGRTVAFALDFHSTFRDVLYTVTEDPARVSGGALSRWVAAMHVHTPELEERPSAATGGSPVFKNWAYCRFGAPAVTYEVGDTTPRAALDALSRHAAVSLMEILAEDAGRASTASVPTPACMAAAPDDD